MSDSQQDIDVAYPVTCSVDLGRPLTMAAVSPAPVDRTRPEIGMRGVVRAKDGADVVAAVVETAPFSMLIQMDRPGSPPVRVWFCTERGSDWGKMHGVSPDNAPRFVPEECSGRARRQAA